MVFHLSYLFQPWRSYRTFWVRDWRRSNWHSASGCSRTASRRACWLTSSNDLDHFRSPTSSRRFCYREKRIFLYSIKFFETLRLVSIYFHSVAPFQWSCPCWMMAKYKNHPASHFSHTMAGGRMLTGKVNYETSLLKSCATPRSRPWKCRPSHEIFSFAPTLLSIRSQRNLSEPAQGIRPPFILSNKTDSTLFEFVGWFCYMSWGAVHVEDHLVCNGPV